MAIKKEFNKIKGAKTVEGSPEAKTIYVEWESPATLDEIKETLKRSIIRLHDSALRVARAADNNRARKSPRHTIPIVIGATFHLS